MLLAQAVQSEQFSGSCSRAVDRGLMWGRGGSLEEEALERGQGQEETGLGIGARPVEVCRGQAAGPSELRAGAWALF